MKELNKILKVIMLAVLFACTEEVTPPSIKNIKNKIVVNLVISPGRDISVTVSYSRNAFGVKKDTVDRFAKFEYITDAVVIISNDTEEETLTHNYNGTYSIPVSVFPLEGGVTYRLDVATNEGAVHAITTLPKKIDELESVTYDTSTDILNVAWMDIPGQEDFYQINAYARFQLDSGIVSQTSFFDNDEFISDIKRDGKKISLSSEGRGVGSGVSYDSVMVSFLSTDKMYFDYFEILRNSEDGGEDPFADPVRLPSNIEGGIGLFSAVNISFFTIEL